MLPPAYSKSFATCASSRARLLWMVHTHPGVSRAEMAEESGLSKAAISATVTELLDKGLLVETQTSPSGAGRRRVGLQVNRQAGLALGVEMAANSCHAVLADMAGQVIRVAKRSFEALALGDAVREAADLIRDLAPPARPLVGLGVSVPELVDAAGETMLVSAPKEWEVPLASLLREQLDRHIHVPITLINTYHASTLGEHRCGAGQGAEDVIFISAGDRIGAGFVLAGELYMGNNGSAGDVGHIVVDPTGPPCTCGNVGCLEALAGGPAVVSLALKALREQARDHLLGRSNRPLALREVVEAAAAGDLAALAAVHQAGEYLGLAIAGLVNALNPRYVIIGGPLAEAGDTLIAPLRQAVLRRASPAAYSTVEIVPAALGPDAAAVGAAALAIDRYLLAYV